MTDGQRENVTKELHTLAAHSKSKLGLEKALENFIKDPEEGVPEEMRKDSKESTRL